VMEALKEARVRGDLNPDYIIWMGWSSFENVKNDHTDIFKLIFKNPDLVRLTQYFIPFIPCHVYRHNASTAFLLRLFVMCSH